MKKIFIICIALFLTGCSTISLNNNANTNQTKVIEEVDRKFDYSDGESLIDTVKVRFSSLNRNDEISIIDEDDDFYYYDNNGLILAVDKEYVRTEKDEPFEEYTGYAYSGAELFADYELSDKIEDIYKNEEIEVIDKVGKVLLVYYEDTFGYMYPSDVSDTYIVTRVVKPVETPTQTYSGGGSSSSGTPTPPTPPSPPPSSEPADGQDIAMAFVYSNNQYQYEENRSFDKLLGKILLDNSTTYITLFARNNEIKVLNYDEDTAKVLIHGHVGEIDRKFVRLPNDEKYEEWNGYAYSGAKVYFDFYLEEIMTTLDKNDEVVVIDEIDDVYVVELENGVYGYMSIDDVSETFIPTYKPAPAPEPVVTPSYSGGSSTPSSPPSPPPATDSWSAPTL